MTTNLRSINLHKLKIHIPIYDYLNLWVAIYATDNSMYNRVFNDGYNIVYYILRIIKMIIHRFEKKGKPKTIWSTSLQPHLIIERVQFQLIALIQVTHYQMLSCTTAQGLEIYNKIPLITKIETFFFF